MINAGVTMTAFVLEPQPFRRPSPEVAVSIGLASAVAVLTLFVAGVTCFGLAIAPIAGRLMDLWWLYAGLSIASFAGAAVVAGKAAGFLSPDD
jgi:hypothetical protein